MTNPKDPFIRRNILREWIGKSGSARALMINDAIMAETERLMPISAARVANDAPVSTTGYIAAGDGRIAYRVVHNAEAQEKFGVDALTTTESIFLSLRISQIDAVEEAALDAQAAFIKRGEIAKAFRSKIAPILEALSQHKTPQDRQVADAIAALKTLDAEIYD